MHVLFLGAAALLLASLTGKRGARRTSTATEGEPLSWDENEHPAAYLPASSSSSSSAESDLVPPGNDYASESAHSSSSSSSSADAALAAELDLAELELDPVHERFSVSLGDAVVDSPAPAALPQTPAPAPTKRKSSSKRKPAAPRAPAASAPAAPAPASSSSAAPVRSAQEAARDLFAYVSEVLRAKRGSTLGTKGAPNVVVREAQADMGAITADGIYGPATRTRGKALIGKTFPERK